MLVKNVTNYSFFYLNIQITKVQQWLVIFAGGPPSGSLDLMDYTSPDLCITTIRLRMTNLASGSIPVFHVTPYRPLKCDVIPLDGAIYPGSLCLKLH